MHARPSHGPPPRHKWQLSRAPSPITLKQGQQQPTARGLHPPPDRGNVRSPQRPRALLVLGQHTHACFALDATDGQAGPAAARAPKQGPLAELQGGQGGPRTTL